MIAVIAGASGLVGNELIKELIKDPYFSQIIAISRKPISITHNKLINYICENFEELDLISDKIKGDVYFCCLGSTIKKSKTKENFKKVDFDAVMNFAQVAKKQVAANFVMISASGANPDSSIFYNKIKGEVEKSLIDLKLHKLVIYRPGLLIGDRSEKRLAEKISIDLLSFISPLLPLNIEKRISTKVSRLCESMINESKKSLPPLKIIEAKDI
jgi:nucleoside-diphosphate-sugar epimerase